MKKVGWWFLLTVVLLLTSWFNDPALAKAVTTNEVTTVSDNHQPSDSNDSIGADQNSPQQPKEKTSTTSSNTVNQPATTTNQPTKEAASTTKPELKLTGSNHLVVGQKQRLNGQILNATGQLKWRSSNVKVATVNQNGTFKGKKAGSVTIRLEFGGQFKELKIRVTQQTNGTLNSKFKRARKNETIILVGNFKMNGDVKLPTAKNVKINATGASFMGKKGGFYGILNSGLQWTGGYIYSGGHTFSLLRTTNASFSKISFHQACGVSGHVFDLMGCKNININNNDFYGYGHTLDTQRIREISDHDEYAETIQTDYANYDSGGNRFNQYGEGYFNGEPSSYITVTHNTWQPEYDGKRLVSLAQSPIGQHDTISSNSREINHITFTYNTVNDPIRLSGTGSDTAYFGASIHFESASDIDISHNQFNSTMKRSRP